MQASAKTSATASERRPMARLGQVGRKRDNTAWIDARGRTLEPGRMYADGPLARYFKTACAVMKSRRDHVRFATKFCDADL